MIGFTFAGGATTANWYAVIVTEFWIAIVIELSDPIGSVVRSMDLHNFSGGKEKQFLNLIACEGCSPLQLKTVTEVSSSL